MRRPREVSGERDVSLRCLVLLGGLSFSTGLVQITQHGMRVTAQEITHHLINPCRLVRSLRNLNANTGFRRFLVLHVPTLSRSSVQQEGRCALAVHPADRNPQVVGGSPGADRIPRNLA